MNRYGYRCLRCGWRYTTDKPRAPYQCHQCGFTHFAETLRMKNVRIAKEPKAVTKGVK